MNTWTLVLTPLALEWEFLTTALRENRATNETQHGPLNVLFLPELKIACAVGGHGKTQFALQAQFLYHQVANISGLICVGAAGGLTEAVAPLDVVIAEKTIEHDFRLKFVQRPLPEFKGHAPWLERLRDFSSPDFRTLFGPVASGDEDVIEAERARELHLATGAIAVAWEGAGAARVARFHKSPFLEVRGVTDRADGSAPSDFKTNLKIAMKNCARVLETLALP